MHARDVASTSDRTLVTRWIYARLRELPFVRAWRRKFRYRDIDAFLFSFPKAGRTWLRITLGRIFIRHFGMDERLEPGEVADLARINPKVPRIKVEHEDDPQVWTPGELIRRKDEFAASKVMFLVRDPRDIVISMYFQVTRKRKYYEMPISEFIRLRRGSAHSVVRYLNIWAGERARVPHFLLLRYEWLHEDMKRECRRVLDFVGLKDIPDATIDEAVQFSRFENLKEREKQGAVQDPRYKPGNVDDPESFHTRKGKVGGYHQYLSPEDVAWLDALLRDELDPFYGYGVPAKAPTSAP